MAAATTPTEKELRDILEITLFQSLELERFLDDHHLIPTLAKKQVVKDAAFHVHTVCMTKQQFDGDHPLSRLFEAYNDVKEEADILTLRQQIKMIGRRRIFHLRAFLCRCSGGHISAINAIGAT